MLDFTFTEEQEMFRAMVRDFVQKEVAPGYKDRKKISSRPVAEKIVEGQSRLIGFPEDILKGEAKLGLLGMTTAEKYGGNPQSAVTTGIAIEELAGYDASFIQYANAMVNFVNLGSEEVKEEWLPAMTRGEKWLNMGATEAEAGSDLGNARATARRDGDYWILNGEKNRVSSCFDGDGMIALCRTDLNSRRLSPFLVTYDLPGVTRSGMDDICPGEYAGIVAMEDVRVPHKYLLGDEEGRGFRTAMETFDGMRAEVGLTCMRIAQMSLDETIEYVKQRVAFGRPIAKFEGVSFTIAEAATYIEMGRWLAYRTLWMQDQGIRTTKYSSMIKWWAPRTAEWIIHECLLLHGHYGYNADMPFGERLFGPAGLRSQIGDGTQHIQKMIIARELMGREYLPYK
ncbi:acyl-CoA dehydrogenase family protein [Chloroflexota bacterium]